ncbi:hypothetical protein PEWE109479_28675 [Pedobacter westerhofensis]
MWTSTLPLGHIKAWRPLFSLKTSRLIEQLIIKKVVWKLKEVTLHRNEGVNLERNEASV